MGQYFTSPTKIDLEPIPDHYRPQWIDTNEEAYELIQKFSDFLNLASKDQNLE